MGVIPGPFADGDILTAANVNQMNSARAGFLRPIDPSSLNEDDNVEDLGTPSTRWKRLHANEATFGSTDNVTIGGKTLTQILEENVIDTNATQELFNNTVVNSTVLLSNSFIKASGDLIMRVTITARPGSPFQANEIVIALTGGKVESRAYPEALSTGTVRGGNISEFTDWFDLSQVSDGATVNVDITALGTIAGASVSAKTIVFKNAF